MPTLRALSEQELVRIWEVGLGQHPLDRALTILLVAFPGTTRDILALLSIGQRDSCLLAVRRQTFGASLVGLAACPACPEQIEFALDTNAMQIPANISPATSMQAVPIEGGEIQFRLPNSLDLAAIVGYRNTAAARNLLIHRCVMQVVQGGEALSVENLPEALITHLATQMEERDPLAEIRIDLNCPACGHHWQMLFDIVSFFWAEITARVKRVLRDVHTLAQAYGWREADILSMSPVRRQLYLEMVT
jgi:hypothetical protein